MKDRTGAENNPETKIEHAFPKVVYIMSNPHKKAYHLSVDCPRLATTVHKIEAVDLCKVCYKSSKAFPVSGMTCHDKEKVY